MNNQDRRFEAQRIRARYTEKESTELDALRALDRKAQRPVQIFSYAFGALSAIVMGAGMSLVMTDVGSTVGLESTMLWGIVVGVCGLALAIANYPLHLLLLRKRKKKYAPEILALTEAVLDQQ